VVQGDPPAAKDLGFKITAVANGYRVLAVDRLGTIFAIDVSQGQSRLYASTDRGVSWTQRAKLADAQIFKVMTVLGSGTLLADTADATSAHTLLRSTDDGATWAPVLDLTLPDGQYRLLEPHNVAELEGTIFLGLYQVFADEAPVPLYVSTDDGATWTERYVFHGRRHCHSLLPDAATGALWAFFGDSNGGLLRSTDGGYSFDPVVDGFEGVGVEGAITKSGIIYGTDFVFTPFGNVIFQVDPKTGALTQLGLMPGPSYSVRKLDGGGYLMGETREATGNAASVYADGDEQARLFRSADGITFAPTLEATRVDPADYARIDVVWQLPTGEAVVELYNASGYGITATGFLLAKAVLE
jgi:hypothetical protein